MVTRRWMKDVVQQHGTELDPTEPLALVRFRRGSLCVSLDHIVFNLPCHLKILKMFPGLPWLSYPMINRLGSFKVLFVMGSGISLRAWRILGERERTILRGAPHT